ncbi:MAG: ADP-ribosylglycohydrolase family protein [Bacillota bacterium]|nr:ADP-ribosylglycohydrolase family protein [Bacillota bacterium]
MAIHLVGAAFGDIIGSPYEFDENSIKTKDFPLISENSRFTDDTVMTVAVAEGLVNSIGGTDEEIRMSLIKSVKKWGRCYPNAGYGARFLAWLNVEDSLPYGSFGNGSAMRCSAAGWLASNIYDARRLGRLTAEITHDHIEGVKAAEAVSAAIFLARIGEKKKTIRRYIETEFGYNLDRTCKEIRVNYRHFVDCMRSVPEAIIAFLEGDSLVDCIRNAVSLGGDSDTIAAIAGSIAEAYYGFEEELMPLFEGLPSEMKETIMLVNEHIKEI